MKYYYCQKAKLKQNESLTGRFQVISNNFVVALDKFARREFKGVGDQEVAVMEEVLQLTIQSEKILQLGEDDYTALNMSIVKEAFQYSI